MRSWECSAFHLIGQEPKDKYMANINFGRGKYVMSRSSKRYEILRQGSGVVIRKLKTEETKIIPEMYNSSSKAVPSPVKHLTAEEIAARRAAETRAASTAKPAANAVKPSAPAIEPLVPSSTSFAELQKNIAEANRIETERRIAAEKEAALRAEEAEAEAKERAEAEARAIAQEQANAQVPFTTLTAESSVPADYAEETAEEATPASEAAEETTPASETDEAAEETAVPSETEDSRTAEPEVTEEAETAAEAVSETAADEFNDEYLQQFDKKTLQGLYELAYGKKASRDVSKFELRKKILDKYSEMSAEDKEALVSFSRG